MNQNPIIRHKFTADPTVLSYNDTLYLYTGHDEAPDNTGRYLMREWLCFSSRDLQNWTEHPVPLNPKNFSWADKDAYASKVIERNGTFFWYVAVTETSSGKKSIGVASADSPVGPFRDARGSALISAAQIKEPGQNYDPSVLIDDDQQAYIFWGKKICYYAMLNENLVELKGDIKQVLLPDFVEGIHIHKREGWYYLSYGYGFPEKVGYAMSRSIHGPWQFKSILNELAFNCETNRPAVLDFQNKTYFFYHNGALPGGGSQRRSVCIDYLHYNADGTIQKIVMTSSGVGPVK
jgi:beta-xylosidase